MIFQASRFWCNTAPLTSQRASAKHGAALPPPMLRSTCALTRSRAACNDAGGATMCSTQQSCRFSHDLTVCRVHCALFGHPRPSYKPRSSTHLPTCFREALPPPMLRSTCALTRSSLQGCLWCNHVLVTSISAAQASTPIHSPAPSTPKPRAPPVSLPSIFPPSPNPTRLPSHPRAFRRAPLHPCTSIFHPQPRRLPSRSPPSSLPSPWRTSGLRPTLRRTVSDGSPVWATCGVGRVAVPSFVGLAFGCIIHLEPE